MSNFIKVDYVGEGWGFVNLDNVTEIYKSAVSKKHKTSYVIFGLQNGDSLAVTNPAEEIAELIKR